MKKVRNREFLIVTYVILALLISLCGYFCYYLSFKSETFINNPYNKRIDNLESSVIRGDIKTRDGSIVAETIIDTNGNQKRVYPSGRMYAHTGGYAGLSLQGAENDYNFSLLRSHSFILTRLQNEIFERKNMGDTLVLSIDSKLQKVAFDAMGDYRGAVIAIDPDTGDVLCNVSKPDFDPNTIESEWEKLSKDNDASPLINRAIQGLYPPGSTFKILTALEHLRENGTDTNTYNCVGEYTKNSSTIHCYHNTKHGEESLKKAFANSCNSVFAEIGAELDRGKFTSLCEDCMFNAPLPTSIPNVRYSTFKADSETTDETLMQLSIGQGTTLVTPIHMAMISAAILNKGVVMKPKTVYEITNDKGVTVRKIKPEKYGSIFTEKEALQLKDYMREVVLSGTGTKLKDSPYEAYGKTGTAEYSSNRNEAHSWFTGFAEKDGKRIAISVIMEGAGAGSEYALPLAKKVFDAYFNNP